MYQMRLETAQMTLNENMKEVRMEQTKKIELTGQDKTKTREDKHGKANIDQSDQITQKPSTLRDRMTVSEPKSTGKFRCRTPHPHPRVLF